MSDHKHFGYATVTRRSADRALVIDMVDHVAHRTDPSFHFAVFADGSPAPP
jgi:hypothetical protein